MEQLDRYERLRRRRTPAELLAEARQKSASFSEAEKDFDYLVDVMQPIDPEFTENTFREGDRIWNQLEKNLPPEYNVEFQYQGSVTSDTHIRLHSDIDLLALNGCFVSLDQGALNSSPYKGNAKQELCDMRDDAAALLKQTFPEVTVDDSAGKSICLEGGSLNRKIDVVVGNWWDTELWKKNRSKVVRGIRIVDTRGPTLIKNKPFLHNYRIDEKDKKSGGLRKVIRLLKSLKYDAEPELKISSYDIAALAWNMSDAALTVQRDAYLPLATNARDELKRFIDNEVLRNGLKVPNGTRAVFDSGGATVESLRQIHSELVNLIQRIEIARIINFSKTAAASTRKPLPQWEERRPQVILEHSY